jgi:hypothetical protein
MRENASENLVYLKVQLSNDDDHESALAGAYDQRRTNCVPGPTTQELRTPVQFDQQGEGVSKEQVERNVRVSPDPEDHVEWIQKDLDLGTEEVTPQRQHQSGTVHRGFRRERAGGAVTPFEERGEVRVVPPGFEPGSKPPEGFRIGRYPMGLYSSLLTRRL